jgi:enterochelin esterase-like enzyme
VGWARAGRLIAPLAIAAVLAAGCAPGRVAVTPARADTAAVPHRLAIHDADLPWLASAPDVRTRRFDSAALHRSMPYLVYLPPGYEGSARRYPVLYLLHGMGGSSDEWRSFGVFDVTDRMIRAGEMAPLIIVLPQGDQAYWVDHAGTDGELWGTYTARDVVGDVDRTFRTAPDRGHRAIGGLSMGAHGAMQLALNYPTTFGVVGAHSLVLRRFGSAPGYFGNSTDFAKRDPMQLVATKADVARSLALWIDIGDRDEWAPLANEFEGKLTGLGIAHQWHEWSGDHSASYWSAHLRDYLRFYDSALAVKAAP